MLEKQVLVILQINFIQTILTFQKAIALIHKMIIYMKVVSSQEIWKLLLPLHFYQMERKSIHLKN